jgi:hypothetical protein
MNDAMAAAALLEAFDAGARLFDEGRYWDAHEAWEERWRVEAEPQRTFLQGLIQISAAFHKLFVMRNAASASRLLAKGLAKLDASSSSASWSPSALAVDYTSFRASLEECASALAEQKLERSAIPRLRPASFEL